MPAGRRSQKLVGPESIICPCSIADRRFQLSLFVHPLEWSAIAEGPGSDTANDPMTPATELLATSSRVDHIGIAVPDLTASARFYRDVLGCAVSEPHEPPGQGIAVVFVQMESTRVELLAPTEADSPIRHVLEDQTINDFLARHPAGGLHHICYVVDDLDALRPRLAAAGVRVLGTGEPILGASGLPIVFLDPRTTGGTLIELKQRAPG
jgi:methylmalonyl-CoA/ethylmalonyl-CoA epimerase